MKNSAFEKIYQELIKTAKDLENHDGPSFKYADFIELINKNNDLIYKLKDEYNNDYIQSIYENNELYSFYSTKIAATTKACEEDIKKLQEENKQKITNLNNDYQKVKTETINTYKERDADFSPKTNFLSENKKANRDEYIKKVREYNEERLVSNHQYEEIANDLVNKNEQVQYDFKHTYERFTEKNTLDSTKLQAKLKDNIDKINAYYDEVSVNLQQEINDTDKKIADKTAKLNQKVTELSSEYQRRHKFGFIPYDMEYNKTLDHQEEQNKIFAIAEESILKEFKENLQKIDNELEKERTKRREKEHEHAEKMHKVETTFSLKLAHELKSIDQEINDFRNKHEDTKEGRKTLKKLYKDRESFRKNQIKNHEIHLDDLRTSFFLSISEDIIRIEKLRSDKVRYEAIKSNAMKALNSERDYFQSLFQSHFNVIGKKKEYFVAIENCEENKAVLDLRLPHDIDINSLYYDINQLEREKHKQEQDRKNKVNETRFNFAYQRELLRVNLEYQKSVLKNRIDHANVSNMLEIQKNKIKNSYDLKISEAKKAHELQKLNFYNDCDNLQYDLYKLSREFFNHNLDEKLTVSNKLYQIHRQGIEGLEAHEIRRLNNNNYLKTSKDRIALHTKRFEIEKNIVSKAYQLFENSFSKVLEVENYLLDSLLNTYETIFNDCKETVIKIFTLLRELKLSLLNDYYENEVIIINSRINFEKDLKYNRLLETLRNDKEIAIAQRLERKNKFQETINSYKNAISIFEKQILNLELKKLNEEIRLNDLKSDRSFTKPEKQNLRNEIRKTISLIKESILTFKLQIKANQKNINELTLLLETANKNIKRVSNKYDRQIEEINKDQLRESKDYYNTINLIRNQYNVIRNLINRSQSLLNKNKFTYERINKHNLIYTNLNKLVMEDFQNLYHNHFNKLCRAFEKQIAKLRKNFIRTYEKHKSDILQSKNNEINSNKAKEQAIKNEHDANVLAIMRTNDTEKRRIYQKLKDLNATYSYKITMFKTEIANLEKSLNFELECQEENAKTYDLNYQNQNKLAKTKFLNATNLAKEKLKKAINQLNYNAKVYGKTDKNRQISNQMILNNNNNEALQNKKQNTKHYSLKAHKTLEFARQQKRLYAKNNESLYDAFYHEQKLNHEDFKILLYDLEDRLRFRIKNQLREYKKNLWK